MADRPPQHDAHKEPAIPVRLPRNLRADLRAILAAKGWTMTEFFHACAVLLTQNPTAMLGRLNTFRPPPRRGRPRKAAAAAVVVSPGVEPGRPPL